MTATPVRRLYRSPSPRVLGGVAQGLADHLGVPVLWVRLAFVLTTLFQLAGVLAYAAFWVFVPLGGAEGSPGLASATRRGLRSDEEDEAQSNRSTLQTAALVVLGVGMVFIVVGSDRVGSLLFPAVLAITGFALIWRQADDRSLRRWVRETSGWQAVLRTAAGTLLVLIAYGVFVAQLGGGLESAAQLLGALVVAVAGAGLLLGPWIVRLLATLGEERRERVRSQERADVAAHLHDSVLQTLALLQKNANDPAQVATLARRQERELRDWLYGEPADDGTTLRKGLVADATEIETAYRIPIEVVGVGDAEPDPDVDALRAAAREAMTNAVKHSGADRIDVYVEVSGTAAEVFVRDRGHGFDPAQVPEDRLGIRRSLVARMERHGGTAVVRSSPGDGTEVRLALPLVRDRSPNGGRDGAPEGADGGADT
ncbi:MULTISPECIES: ATP-binding protein [Mumia]|uniref:ATP-binding protein n=1 Tax=Mumia TaxID=1546255 RepID=UPI00141ED622|nr:MULTISPECIES: ATP-binding protein [unclassified Mumia]QMW68523.1 PspC domain-containing protein [Mumia sp. ZJ1417]